MKDKKGPVKSNQGTVLTTEEEEIQFRQQRGRKESMQIKPLKRYPYPFDSFNVGSSSGLEYLVEIRSLTDPINSCNCPDYKVNTLGTCKHIEAVLYKLKEKKHKTHLNQPHSPLVEIFLDTTDANCVSVAWPPHVKNPHPLTTYIKPLFSSNDTLISDPIIGVSSIYNALNNAPEDLQSQIRISTHLTSWIDTLKEQSVHYLSREQFLQDVEEGKRSLQMLSSPLYRYQEEGMLHLAFQRRAILADEMGLGKTIQAIAACELLRRLGNVRRVLVISPASLKGEWEEQIAKFTGLPSLIIQGSRPDRLSAYQKQSFFYLANYEQIRSDFEEIQRLLCPDIVILDEAQRIKNWQTKTAWAVKQLKSPYAFVLTGTPLENRIDEVYSIMQMVNPHILGPLFKFNRNFYEFNEKNKPIGYKNLDELRRCLKPVLLRRLKKDVEEQLPERTVNNFYVEMSEEQQLRYAEYNERVAKLWHIMKKRPLTEEETRKLLQNLGCMRMIADTPYILDDACKICPKLDELKQVLSELMENPDNKIIIFSEWERMLTLVRDMITSTFNASFAWHTGTVPQDKRRAEINRFKNDPHCRFFLTTDSGSMGLNLQVANIVINMDLPWNPAKLEQRIARAWRKNQTRVVQVINFISKDCIETRMLSTLEQKQALASGILDGVGDLTSMPMPSARREILEDLEDLIIVDELEPAFEHQQTEEAPKKEAPKSFEESIKETVIAHFNDRVHMLQEVNHEHSKKKVVMAVVDTLDRQIQPKMQELVNAHAKQSKDAVQLEMLDVQTYELLQRLAQAGVITINGGSNILYRSESAERVHQTEKQQRLQEAKKYLADAERKMKMSLLLSSGGFVLEALTPAKEALSASLKSYFTWKREEHSEGKDLLSRLENGIDSKNEKNVIVLLELVETFHKQFSEEFERNVMYNL
jgi:superfamily II DNA/RNA helicase